MNELDYLASTNKDELIEYAASLGIEVTPGMRIDSLKNHITAHLSENKAKTTQADDAPQVDEENRVPIVIHKTEGDSGSINVPISVQGKTYLIKRGEKVLVPLSVVEVLRNAIKTLYSFDEKENQTIKRDVPSYPFSILSDD